MNRRAFLTRLAAAPIAAVVAIRALPAICANVKELPSPTAGTYGSIIRAEYSFWRNQSLGTPLQDFSYDELLRAMETIQNRHR